jgi:hypothetical protein
LPPPIFILYILIGLISCQKLNMQNSPFGMKTSSLALKPQSDIYANTSFTSNDTDSVETITVLGNQLPNPYLIPNMRQAYLNLGYDPNRAVVNDLYVSFLPSLSQLATLDSVMDSQGYELFDTPMDYEIISEGDYYQDPSIPDSLPTWQYAVVAPDFVAPSGMNYQVLAQIHIPPDDFTAVETEAESIAGGGGAMAPQQQTNSVNPNVLQCGAGYHWDYSLMKCVPNECTYGYHWDNGQQQCVPNTCPAGYYWSDLDGTCKPYNTTPPAPAPYAQIPKGCITVTDNNLGTQPGVRQIRIVAKRWFKIERTYTNDNGCFNLTKHFKNKVKIVAKFKNQYCNIRGIRGLMLWQSLYAVRRTLGVYDGNQNNIVFNFDRFTTSTNQKGNRYWVAATANNAVLEHRDYCSQFGFSGPPLNLNIYITDWGIEAGLASTPLFGKRYWSNVPSSFVNTFLVGLASNSVPLVGWYISFFSTIARTRLDMAVDYHINDMCRFSSDHIKETFYHELSHASQYNQVGDTWYTNFVNAELDEAAAHPGANDKYNPYGDGHSSNSPIIALGEAWGYHMGHFLANQTYPTTASPQSEQVGGETWTSTMYSCGFSPNSTAPHADVLENFVPNSSTDPFNWIPKGLMWDLIDNGENFTVSGVNDQVSGYTIN